MTNRLPGLKTQLLILFAFCCLYPVSYAAAETTTSLIQQAMRATAARDFAAASRAYEQVLRLEPQTGFPLYARFLARTKQTTQLQELLDQPLFHAQPALVKARTAIAAGQTSQAIALLEETTAPADLYAARLALYQLLRDLGQDARAQQRILETVRMPQLTAGERLDLFSRILRNAPPDKIADVFLELLHAVVHEQLMDFPALRDFVAEALAYLDGRPGFAEFRSELARRGATDGVAAWIYAIALERRGDVDEARAILEKALASEATATTPARCLVLEELAQSPGLDLANAEKLYKELLPITSNPDRVRLRLAGILFKAKRYTEVVQTIAQINRARLSDVDQKLAANMRLTALAKVAPAADVVRAFEEEARGKPYAYLRELAEAPFALLPETSDHLKYRAALQGRLRETTAPTELYVLMMSTENQLRTPNAVVAALDAYTQAHPEEYEALNEYAIAASQYAFSLVTGPQETTPSAEMVTQAVDQAARALWRVVSSRPYAIEPYQRLIHLYRAAGLPDKAQGVALSLMKHTSATAEQVHLAAYLLDETGYTTEALPLYRDAIARDPQNGRFKMNLANALRKLGRNSEALALYYDLFEHGSYGRQHHIHQLTEDAWEAATKSGQTAELIRFWRKLAQREDLPQRDEFLVHVGSLLVDKKHFTDGLDFLALARRAYPDLRDEIEPIEARAAAMQGDVARAERIYMERVKRASTEYEKIDARLDYGKLLAGVGAFKEAVAAWEKLASDYPQNPKAARALLLAAQAHIANNDFAAAQELLAKYQSRDRGDSDGERQARELLETLTHKATNAAPHQPAKQ